MAFTSNPASSQSAQSKFTGLSNAALDLVRLIHGSSDQGFISFALGDEDGFHPAYAVRSKYLAVHPPNLNLEKDGYISLNQAGQVQRGADNRLWYGHPKHREDTLTSLCALGVDLDFYASEELARNAGFDLSNQDELTEEQRDAMGRLVLAQVNTLVNSGTLPPFSILIRGRGIWLLWMLRDNGQPVPATPANISLYKSIHEQLHHHLAHLGSDKNVQSPVRYVRLPGSLNTKSETEISWQVQTDDQCSMPRYSLRELWKATAKHYSPPIASAPVDDAQPWSYRERSSGRNGKRALRDRRWRDFEKLHAIRGEFSKGCRNSAIFYQSLLLRDHGEPISAALAKAHALNNGCGRPLRSSEMKASVCSAYKRNGSKWQYWHWTDRKFADDMRITPAEAEHLECKTVATKYQKTPPPCKYQRPAISRKQQETSRIGNRQQAILEIVERRAGDVPASREMATLLAKQGINTSHMTIARDYQMLSLSSSEKA